MPIDSEFRAASEAAHYWPSGIALAAIYIRHGTVTSVKIAYQLLVQLLLPGYQKHAELLREMMDKLTDVSDGPVKWEHGRGLSGVCRVPTAVFPHRWSSAHEAALEITYLTLNQLFQPISEIADPAEQWVQAQQLLTSKWARDKWAKAFEISIDEVADLQERIRRERVKLLKSLGEGSRIAGLQRLRFDVDTYTIYLDGKRYTIKQPRAFQLYQRIAANHQPITRKELRANIKGLQGDKTIRNLLNTLPKALLKTVKSGTRLGYWLELPSVRSRKVIRKSSIIRP